MTKSTANKSKTPRKQQRKKQHIIHPYLECIHGEIAQLQEEILAIEELHSTRELTGGEKLDLSTKNACLARYQVTLIKLTEQSMANKLNMYTSAAANATLENRQKETITFLQLMYLMRLGQLGLYQFIETAPSLDIIASLCDQIIGAAVYYASESSNQIKEQKKHRVCELLRKWDQASNDVIDESLDKTTFRQLRDFLHHIWDHSEVVKDSYPQIIDNEQTHAVLQFEGMIPKDTSVSTEAGLPSESKAPVETNAADVSCVSPNLVNLSHSVETVQTSESEDTRGLKEPSGCDTTINEMSKTQSKGDVRNESFGSSTLDNSGQSKVNEDSNNELWDGTTKSETDNLNERGWKSIDNSVKGESWNGADSQTEKVIEDKSKSTTVMEDTTIAYNNTDSADSKSLVDSNENDNWRRRDEHSPGRGRGRGYRGGRGRGKVADRGRGRGIPRGRGRGRRREFDEDYNRNIEPTAPPQ